MNKTNISHREEKSGKFSDFLLSSARAAITIVRLAIPSRSTAVCDYVLWLCDLLRVRTMMKGVLPFHWTVDSHSQLILITL